MYVDKIPHFLRSQNQWLVWKEGKQPFQTNGTPAKSNDPSTWCSFDDAVLAMHEDFNVKGVGFVMTDDDDVVGIDLDGCRCPDTGKVQPWAREIIERCDSYSEVSPSKTGVKIFVRGHFDGSGRKKDIPGATIVRGGKRPQVELYKSGRFFAVTSWRVAGVAEDVEQRQPAIDWLLEKYFPVQPIPLPQAPATTDHQVLERAAKYLACLDPAISGQGGHHRAYHAASVLCEGFNLTPEMAFALFAEYNARCEPPWSERELWHKLRDARKNGREFGRLLHSNDFHVRHAPSPVAASPARTSPAKWSFLSDGLLNTVDELENGQEHVDLWSTGLSDLDYALGGGVERGEMMIVAARPSHGKSAFSLQMTHHLTAAGIAVLYISEEMPMKRLAGRSMLSIVDIGKSYWKSEVNKVRRAVVDYAVQRAVCAVVQCVTLDRVCNTIDKAVAELGVQAVVVDYSQQLASKGRSQYEKVTNISNTLQSKAQQHNLLMICNAQLNREVENRTKFVPKMADLRDSGSLEQDADVVLLCAWPWKHSESNPKDEYMIFVGKNRNREINQGVVKLKFNASRQMFSENPVNFRDPDEAAKRHAEFDDWNNR